MDSPKRRPSVLTFRDFCSSLGIIPPESIEPGRTHRCATETHPRKRNALCRLDADLRGGIVVNYEADGVPIQWRSDGEKIERDLSADNAARSLRIARKRQEEREGIERARKAYDQAMPILFAEHPYLARKRIQSIGVLGLRKDAGDLLIPMFRRVSTSQRTELVNVQRIMADGEKKFTYQAPAKLAHFWIERPKSCVTVLCEGWATGATAFESLPTCSVIVCFSASNLVAIAERFDWSGLVCVAADFDRDTEESTGKNPGREAGDKAAKAIGCGVAYPEFCEGSDWNDHFTEALARIEETTREREEFKPYKTPPHKLRAMALAPIQAALMKAARFVGTK